MVRIAAAGETGPLLQAKRRIPIIFFIGTVLLVSLAPDADCDTGAPGIGKKTESALLCQEFGFQHISLDDILREKSDDQTYPHAEFVKDCLAE